MSKSKVSNKKTQVRSSATPAQKPRKLQLSPLEGNILRLLEEAGGETVPTLVASVGVSAYSDFTVFLLDFVNALEHLWQLGLVSFVRHIEEPGKPYMRMPLLHDEIKPQLKAIHQDVSWDENKRWFNWDESQAGPYALEVVLTKEGYHALVT